MEPTRPKNRPLWQTLLGAAVALALIVAVVNLVHKLAGGTPERLRKAPHISLIPTTPPPPPPPPKVEKKPEPPKDKDLKEMKVVEQNVVKQQAAPDPLLKMEGTAGNGPSAFASGTVTSEDLSKLGGGGGGKDGLFNPFNNYAVLMKSELQRLLARRSELKRRGYSIELRVWVSGDGAVKRSELLGTSGDADTDDSIRLALGSLPPFSEVPPANMPQPIHLRLINKARL